jgi:excisionase family DNA binding protein
MKDRISVSIAARMLGVSTERVRQLITEGKIEAWQLRKGCWYRVSRASVQRLLESDT